jgi:hypothetical protein
VGDVPNQAQIAAPPEEHRDRPSARCLVQHCLTPRRALIVGGPKMPQTPGVSQRFVAERRPLAINLHQ